MQKKIFFTLLGLGMGLSVVGLLAATGRASLDDARILAIVFTCILLWAIPIIPGMLVSLLFFFLSTVATSVPVAQIFSGFSSSAFWLVFSGSVIGFMLKESGLSERIGTLLARCIGKSYLKALLAFAILSFLLSLAMPSTYGRIAILVPIALGYCTVVQLDENSNGRRGILLLVIVGSFELAAAVLPANLPNVIMAGILEQSHGIKLSYSEYFFIFFPAGVLVRGTVLIAVSYKLFRDNVREIASSTEYRRMSGREIHALILLAITLSFWFTDSLHRIAPGWIGLGFAIIYFLTSPATLLSRFTESFKMDLLWFIAAIIGLTALINQLDIRFAIPTHFSSFTEHPALLYITLVATAVALCFGVTSNAVSALFVPLTSPLLHHSALLKMGMLSQVIGYATTFLPYQAPPIAFGAELAKIDRGVMLKYCIVTGTVGLLSVVPANGLWWRLIGLL